MTLFSDLKQDMLAMVASLGAEPLPIPEGLALMEGELRSRPVAMESLAWHSRLFRLIRYTALYSDAGIDTFNLVLYPHHCFDAPIFASDWVVGGGQLRVAVIDAMPLFAEEAPYYNRWVGPFMPLHEESLRLAPVYERKLSWSTKYLGDAACLATGVPATGETLLPLKQLWRTYLAKYLELMEGARMANRQLAVEAWHASYHEAHLAVEDKRNPYMVYFGKELGGRYNREFLFSNTFGGTPNMADLEAYR